jgi:hypothetical protein
MAHGIRLVTDHPVADREPLSTRNAFRVVTDILEDMFGPRADADWERAAGSFDMLLHHHGYAIIDALAQPAVPVAGAEDDPLECGICGDYTVKGIEVHETCLAALRAAHPEDDGLDAAWKAAEAALPEGWAIDNLRHTAMMDQRWQAEAGSRIGPVVQWNKVRTVIAEGPTPAAALRALAAHLRSTP